MAGGDSRGDALLERRWRGGRKAIGPERLGLNLSWDKLKGADLDRRQ
jgi:hypothetical protein